MDLSKATSSSCPETLGLPDFHVCLLDKENQGQPSRGDRGGRGYGAYRGVRGRGGKGHNHLGHFDEGTNPSAPQRPAKSWAEVANMPSRSLIKLKYIPPLPSENPNVVELPPRSGDLGRWETCLVGYFLDKKLPYNYVKNSVSNQWKNMGLNDVSANGEGFMFFFFDNADACASVLEGGPQYVGNQLLLLKKWKRMMKLTKEYVAQIPVWLKLFNVPMEYWDFEGLSRIASHIGVPFFMDHLTSSGTKISFARVCVEVNVDSTLPQSFFVKYEDEVVEIRVEYEGIPAKCEHCKAFGHDTKKCITNQVAKLVQLQKEIGNEQDDGWKTVKTKGKKQIKVPEGIDSDAVQQDLPIHSSLPPLSTTTVEVSQHILPTRRESLIPGVNQEDSLKDLHDELLGQAQVLSPKANQIIEKVDREVLAVKTPLVNVDIALEEGIQNVTPTDSGSKKQKAAGKASGSQRKKNRLR